MTDRRMTEMREKEGPRDVSSHVGAEQSCRQTLWRGPPPPLHLREFHVLTPLLCLSRDWPALHGHLRKAPS